MIGRAELIGQWVSRLRTGIGLQKDGGASRVGGALCPDSGTAVANQSGHKAPPTFQTPPPFGPSHHSNPSTFRSLPSLFAAAAPSAPALTNWASAFLAGSPRVQLLLAAARSRGARGAGGGF